MKKISILLALIFLFFTSSSNLFAQDNGPDEPIFEQKGEHRSNVLQINDNIILPRGEIIIFEYSCLDTTRFYQKQKSVTKLNTIKELISNLEKGNVSSGNFELRSGTSLYIEYLDGQYFDIITSENDALLSNSDTAILLKNMAQFCQQMNYLYGYKPFDINILDQTNSIKIKYKKTQEY